MSNNIELIDLYKIEAPELSDTSYGESIKDRFDKINDNFNKITNSGFLRGIQGESIKLSKILLSDSDEEGKKWLNAIKNKISSLYTETPTLLNPIIKDDKQINWYDNIINKYIYVYFAVIENEDDSTKMVSMMPFTLKDARYDYDNFLNEENNSLYSLYKNIEDVSCIIGFNGELDDQGNPIIELINTMPTIYFDALSGAFCWKIWGVNTGLVASGPPGNDGKNGEVIICVRGSKSISNGAYPIKQIISNGNPFDVNSSNYEEYINKTAIILPADDESQAGFWISTLNAAEQITESNDYYLQALCADYNNVLTELTIDADYFASDIAPKLTSYFLKFTNYVFNIKKSKESEKDIVVIDNTESENSQESITGDLKIKLNTTIEPVGDGSSKHSIEVTKDGIFITIEGTRYKLDAGEDGNLKIGQ